MQRPLAMGAASNAMPAKPAKTVSRGLITAAAALAVVIAIGLDTTVVHIGSQQDLRQKAFSPEAFGAEQFPKIRDSVEQKAVEATTLSEAIAADKKAAGEKYGVAGGGIGPVIPVKFTGQVLERKANYNTVQISGLSGDVTVRVQTGPALNGTDLRDATGTISFGQFTNQIEYQNAGSAINNEVKSKVLAGIDPDKLAGKTVSVVGVFQLINPKNWLVTPVSFEVK
ncbi:putative lipoprotein [Agrobacterium vitis]|nr:putative lipoprotein [Agrobacterium vitis]MBE1436480.1 putative lipoprotein [Agrobacterium vitis]